MASFNLQNFGPCLCRFREIRLFSQNLTDFVNYNKPPENKCFKRFMNNIHVVKVITRTVEKKLLVLVFRTLVQYPYKLGLS